MLTSCRSQWHPVTSAAPLSPGFLGACQAAALLLLRRSHSLAPSPSCAGHNGEGTPHGPGRTTLHERTRTSRTSKDANAAKSKANWDEKGRIIAQLKAQEVTPSCEQKGSIKALRAQLSCVTTARRLKEGEGEEEGEEEME